MINSISDDGHTVSNKSVVISLHGIRTRGKWQRDLALFVQRAGFEYFLPEYGYFNLFALIWPSARRRKVEWFLAEYTRLTRDGLATPPSIIAHSMGSYIVAMAMERYPQIKFDRIIFCGSIVRRSYNWTNRLNNSQFQEVLNDCGKRDIWAVLAEWFVQDAGPSGRFGFEDLARGHVRNEIHSSFRHSDYFYELNYAKQWIPFLRHEPFDSLVLSDRCPFNPKFAISCFVVLTLLGSILFTVWNSWKWEVVVDRRIAVPVNSNDLDGTPVRAEAQRSTSPLNHNSRSNDGTFVAPTPERTTASTPRPIAEPELVRISGAHDQDFFIGKCEVTNSEYKAYLLDVPGRVKPFSLTDEGVRDFGMDRQPVTGLSYRDAVAYCDWLKGKTGKEYRLPSVLEWDLAAYAQKRYPSGNEVLDDRYANLGNTRGKTVSVGTYYPEVNKTYDMAGNVAEWCAIPGNPGKAAAKGGSWRDAFRQAGRDAPIEEWPDHDRSRRYVGFRVAL